MSTPEKWWNISLIKCEAGAYFNWKRCGRQHPGQSVRTVGGTVPRHAGPSVTNLVNKMAKGRRRVGEAGAIGGSKI